MKQKLILLILVFTSFIASAAKVDTLLVWSEAMQKSIPNLVIVPEHYSSQNENFGVLYLLHGAGGDYTNWVTKIPELKTYVDTYNMIIVCPDGGVTSWYFDS